jgi:hypothetical protein
MLNRTVKLTKTQRERLLREHVVSEDKTFWCYEICQLETLTQDQYNTAIAICNMGKVTQRKYVIVDDILVLSPTKKQTHQITVIR